MEIINFDKQLWQLYITAKKSILDKNAIEIKIEDYQLDVDRKKVIFKISYENPLLTAQRIIERYFKNVEIKGGEGLIQFSVSKENDQNTIQNILNIIENQLEPLFFEVGKFPIITISLISNNSFINEIEEYYDEKGDYFKLPRQKILIILNKNMGFELAERIQVRLSYSSNKKSELRNYENILLGADIKLKIKDRLLMFDFGSVSELDKKLDSLKKIPLDLLR